MCRVSKTCYKGHLRACVYTVEELYKQDSHKLPQGAFGQVTGSTQMERVGQGLIQWSPRFYLNWALPQTHQINAPVSTNGQSLLHTLNNVSTQLKDSADRLNSMGYSTYSTENYAYSFLGPLLVFRLLIAYLVKLL